MSFDSLVCHTHQNKTFVRLYIGFSTLRGAQTVVKKNDKRGPCQFCEPVSGCRSVWVVVWLVCAECRAARLCLFSTHVSSLCDSRFEFCALSLRLAALSLLSLVLL